MKVISPYEQISNTFLGLMITQKWPCRAQKAHDVLKIRQDQRIKKSQDKSSLTTAHCIFFCPIWIGIEKALN